MAQTHQAGSGKEATQVAVCEQMGIELPEFNYPQDRLTPCPGVSQPF